MTLITTMNFMLKNMVVMVDVEMEEVVEDQVEWIAVELAVWEEAAWVVVTAVEGAEIMEDSVEV